jgi:muramidase (phage lysozyme)
MATERQVLEQWAKQNPGLFEGLKQAVAGAEGTILGGKPGYNVMFGGGRIQDLSRHPDRVVRSGKYASAAAGAYQFMPGTWQGVKQSLGLSDFGPQSQDIGMLKLARDRLLPLGGLSAISKANALTPEIQAALAPEWASFPTATGSSYYGQPVKKAQEIQNFFEQGRKRSAQSPVATASGSQRSVEDILSSVLGGASKPGLEETNAKATSLVDTIKESLIKSLLTPIINPLGTL